VRESVARRIVLGLLGQIREGRLTLVEGARRHEFGSGAPAATIQAHSPALWPHLVHGGRGLAEAYAQGLWDSPDAPPARAAAA
jgi:cyclopropane-fatty-acyl-phospholipid synthase